jgi:hypothetical protein
MANQSHHAATDSYYLDDALWARVRKSLLFLMLISGAVTAAGAVVNTKQFFFSWVVAFFMGTVTIMGALFFILTMYLTGAAWSVTIRRFSETLVSVIPYGAILFIPLALGIHDIYHWSHEGATALQNGKGWWLSAPVFTIRGFVYFALWSWVALTIYRNSTAMDKTKDIERMHSCSRIAAPGLLILFLSVSSAAFDWIMSIDYHWYSTMFGIYSYAGGGLASMCVLVLICLSLRKAGVLTNAINVEHYHDLGKWMFAITVFWTYVAFSQYMLQWYANIPEETVWFRHRFHGSWKYVSLLLVFGHFLFPFFLLLPRAMKRNFTVLRFAACWLLFMEFVDLHWLVMPNLHPEGISLHFVDISAVVFVASFYGFFFWNKLKSNAIVPIGDLRLDQALAHHNI